MDYFSSLGCSCAFWSWLVCRLAPSTVMSLMRVIQLCHNLSGCNLLCLHNSSLLIFTNLAFVQLRCQNPAFSNYPTLVIADMDGFSYVWKNALSTTDLLISERKASMITVEVNQKDFIINGVLCFWWDFVFLR